MIFQNNRVQTDSRVSYNMRSSIPYLPLNTYDYPTCCHFRSIFGERPEATSLFSPKFLNSRPITWWRLPPSQHTCHHQWEDHPTDSKSTPNFWSKVHRPVWSHSLTATWNNILCNQAKTTVPASPSLSPQLTIHRSDRRLSTSYSSTMRTPTTPARADGSNVPIVRNGIPDTIPCLWFQLQTLTTGTVHTSTCATLASWHHTMINFSTQANGYAPRRPPRNSMSHSLPFHRGHQTWHRPETDQQFSSHSTERTTKNIGNHITGQLPSLPRPHKRGTDLLSMLGTPTNNVGSGHP